MSLESDRANERTDRIVDAQHDDIELLQRGPWFLAGALLGGVIAVSVIVWLVILVLG